MVRGYGQERRLDHRMNEFLNSLKRFKLTSSFLWASRSLSYPLVRAPSFLILLIALTTLKLWTELWMTGQAISQDRITNRQERI